ncbi:MAG TPA: TonB-dependent receptor plug domain-containing protein [Opitutaceae bacterium]
MKDVAVSITEITSEFLKDVSAADINDVLVYTAGTESTRNYTAAPAAGIGGYDDTTSSNPNSATRVRGLHAATLMRDYFFSIGTDVGFDSYNIDRVTINRGPNSVLFGLGDPSGSVNYAPKLARTNKSSGDVTARIGSNSDWRLTLDVNQALVPEKLAVRAAVLLSDRGYQQEPSYYKDKRGYLTGTYQPFEKTTLRLGFERAEVRQNTPNSITPIDNVSGWVEAGRPSWDSRTQDWSTAPSYFASIAGGSTVGVTGPDGTLEYTFVDGVSGSDIRFPTYYQPNAPGVFIFSSLGISNEKFVDLHNLNLRPSIANRDLDTIMASWDQQITRDLFFNISYLKEDLDFNGHGWYRANQFAINVDVNQYRPDGTPNPHFGETFMAQRSLDSLSESTRGNDAVRGTLSYKLDLTQQEGLVRWLGRHSFTGFAEDRSDDFVSKGYNGTRTGNPPYLDATDKINVGDWQITYLRYLGGTADTQAKYAAGVPPEIGASAVPHTYWDPATSSWAQDTWGDYYARKRLDAGKNKVSSQAFVWQSYLLNEKIVGLYGWRHDKQTQTSKSYTDRNPATGETDFPANPDLSDEKSASGNTTTYGVVIHPTDWLSFHYNKSQTIQVFASGSLNLYGEPIPLPEGPGEDWGFSLNLMEGRLNLRANWYKTSITNARMGFLGPVVAGQWELPWFDQEVIPQMAAKFGQTWTAADQFTSITYGDSRVVETMDETAKGLELEMTYNPTKNWRIMANVTKQEAVQSNIAPGLTRWKAEVLPKWQAQPWWDGTIPGGYTDPWGVSGNLREQFYVFNSGRVLDTFKAFDGQPNPEIRKWRFNLVNTYNFTDGKLKGWNVGGALRWEDSAAIGYPAITEIINGTETLVGVDIANAYRDGSNVNLDAWVGYSRKVSGDRYTWNIQLNVRDIGRSNGLQPIVKNSDGATAAYRIEFGPTWYLSSSLSW